MLVRVELSVSALHHLYHIGQSNIVLRPLRIFAAKRACRVVVKRRRGAALILSFAAQLHRQSDFIIVIIIIIRFRFRSQPCSARAQTSLCPRACGAGGALRQ